MNALDINVSEVPDLFSLSISLNLALNLFHLDHVLLTFNGEVKGILLSR
jgi:hypothetical protein